MPIRTKAICQPNHLVNSGTVRGVSTAPTAAPELKMPLPRLRSDGGRISPVTRRAHGQLNDSPTPSRARMAIRAPSTGENAEAMAASDQSPTAPAYTLRTSSLSTTKPAGT